MDVVDPRRIVPDVVEVRRCLHCVLPMADLIATNNVLVLCSVVQPDLKFARTQSFLYRISSKKRGMFLAVALED